MIIGLNLHSDNLFAGKNIFKFNTKINSIKPKLLRTLKLNQLGASLSLEN